MSERKPILCLAFDGVLHAFTSGWLGATNIPDGPVPGAMAWLRDAVEAFEVHVYSSRSSVTPARETMRARVREWLVAEHGEVMGRVIFEMLKFPTEKPKAFVALDDRAVTFTGTFPALSDLLAFRSWTETQEGG